MPPYVRDLLTSVSMVDDVVIELGQLFLCEVGLNSTQNSSENIPEQRVFIPGDPKLHEGVHVYNGVLLIRTRLC